MAARKKPGTTVAKRGNTSMANVNEQLAAEAGAIAEQIGRPAGNKIKTADKQFQFPDGTVDAGPIRVVILDFVSRNDLYEGKWDPKNPNPPSCFAMGKVLKDMTPDPESPKIQSDNCAGCPNNAFGSNGDGKACKNTRLLAVIPEDAKSEEEIMTISVSPTALKAFDAYVSTIARLFQTPPIGVSTEIGFHPERYYSSLMFGNPEPNKSVAEHLSLREAAQSILYAKPDLTQAETTKAKPKTKGRRRSAA